MKKNIGGIDRAVRVAAGIVLVLLAALGYIGAWGWIGVVPIATALISFCPLYALLGITSCPQPPKEPLHFHENLPESFKNESGENKQ